MIDPTIAEGVRRLWCSIIDSAVEDWRQEIPPRPIVTLDVRRKPNGRKWAHGLRKTCCCRTCVMHRLNQQIDLLEDVYQAGRFLYLRTDEVVRLAFDASCREVKEFRNPADVQQALARLQEIRVKLEDRLRMLWRLNDVGTNVHAG